MIKIKLDSINKVKGFVDISSRHTEEMQVSSGRYTVNAKSIMGIFSLDLKNELTLHINSEKNLPALLSELTPYIVE